MPSHDNGAMQVDVAAAKIPLPNGTVRVVLRNHGPNAVYLGVTALKASVAAGTAIKAAAAGVPGELTIDKAASDDLYAITTAAIQVSPNDLRWYASVFP